MESARCKPPQDKVSSKALSAARDTVNVFCRIRPLQNDKSCVKVTSHTTVSLQPPKAGASHRLANDTEIRHTFKHVFDDRATQKEVFDHVALPLVENLIHGKNGLIFTYGVTGSGKTFTMTGYPQDGGIVPRSLDVIFNSISCYQAKRFVFKPDRRNGFDIESETELMTDCNRKSYFAKSRRIQMKKKSDADISQRIPDGTKIESVTGYNNYAVFVTYVKIYNNPVYDLLEDAPTDTIRSKPPQVKKLREDARHIMYVHSATEVEVKSSEEAFEAFCRGQKRKRIATTVLNSESSRSHSVFTIRLVQAPLYSQEGNGVQNRKAPCISQLSLVDLAGSERTNRTKNIGQRLRESGNINNSLLTLRTCLEILRENQLSGANKMVPYRDSKMTLLLKNFFVGEGQVEMIVCLNPSAEDYDETIHVMKFAEMTKEVQVDFALPPSRGKGSLILKGALQKVEENCNGESQVTDVDIGHSTDTRNKCPEEETDLPVTLKRPLLLEWQEQRQDLYRKLTDIENGKLLFGDNLRSWKANLDQTADQGRALEKRLVSYEPELMDLKLWLDQNKANLLSLKQEYHIQ
jgi:kinesin family protein 23